MAIPPDMPIRLALMITELEVGGAERCLVRLACGLDRARFAPEVYSLAPSPQNPLLVEQLEAHQVPVHFLGARNVWSVGSLFRQLNRHMQRQQPHIVQSFLFHANIAASYLRRGDWQTVFGVRVADPRSLRIQLERWRARKAQRLACVSQEVQKFLQHHGFPPKKLVTIPNGVDVSFFAAAAPQSLKHVGVPDDAELMLFLGRLEYQKGIDWLLEAIHPVLRERPSAYLVLAGKGDWFRYRSLAREHATRVVCLGWQPDVAGLLRRSALVVLPSRWEGMPNVVLEAMAAGVPLLASDVEGVREALGDVASDQVFALGDGERFAHQAVRLLSDTTLRTHLVEQNRQRAIQCFSIEAMISAYDRLYCDLLCSNG